MNRATSSVGSRRERLIILFKGLFGILLTTGLVAIGGCAADSDAPNPSTSPEARLGHPHLVRTLSNVSTPIAFFPAAEPALLLTQVLEDNCWKFILWDVRSGERFATLVDGDVWSRCAAFSPDGHLLASGEVGGDPSPFFDLRLWDMDKQKPRLLDRARLSQILRGLEYNADSLAFSPDSTLLAVEGPKRQINLWDVATGKLVRAFTGTKHYIGRVVFNPNGNQVAAAIPHDSLPHGNILIWDVTSGDLVRTLKSPSRGPLDDVAFSPDGKLLASTNGYEDAVIDLWDADTGQHLSALRGHKERIYSIAFHPNGHWLASASGDATLRLWDIRKRKSVHTISLSGPAGDVAFSSDGRWLAAQHNNEQHQRSDVSIWDLSLDPTK